MTNLATLISPDRASQLGDALYLTDNRLLIYELFQPLSVVYFVSCIRYFMLCYNNSINAFFT